MDIVNKSIINNQGKAIKLDEKVKFIFETDSLENASPNFVSRCGLVYINDNVV